MSAQRNMNVQVVEWKFLVYSAFSIVLFVCGICYTKNLGGADNKACQMVTAEKPYGPNISVTNLENIGYVQKRMEVRQRRLLKEKISTSVHVGNTFCGKVRLT